jgi:aldose 1-epimerase
LREIELRNNNGFLVSLLDHGATIRSVLIPTPDGPLNAVLTYPDQSDYLHDPFFLGSTLGRYAGRIALGEFSLNGRDYRLARGHEEHCLHGGPGGFSFRQWSVEETGESSALFSYRSEDGEEGFPGGLSVSVRYSLQDDFGLLIEYEATSDADTVINLSNHAYFNLNSSAGGIENHHIVINSSRYAALDESAIPTGELLHVKGSRFDFKRAVCLNGRMRSADDGRARGFDHTFALNRSTKGRAFAASAYSPETGLSLKLFTSQPALQFYTGEYLRSPLCPRDGFCFEAQNFPDAPNHHNFPSAVLRQGGIYTESILYDFALEEKNRTI